MGACNVYKYINVRVEDSRNVKMYKCACQDKKCINARTRDFIMYKNSIIASARDSHNI